MQLKIVHHIAIIASNYERSKDFYVNQLGFTIIRENYREDKQDYKLDLKLDNCEIELFGIANSPKRPNFPEACGLRHVAFYVDSVEETAKELHIGERKFVRFLIKKKYLYRDKKGKLQPYSNYVGDLFTLKECFDEDAGWKWLQLFVTPKGKETFKELYLAAL